MTKTALLLGLATLFCTARPAFACPNDRASFAIDGVRVVHCLSGCGSLRLAPTTISEQTDELIGGDDDAVEAAYLAEEQATATAMHAWMQSLAAGLLALLTVALAGVGLARLALFHCRGDLAAGRLVPVLEKFNPGDLEEIHAVFLGHGGYLPARVRAFLDFLVENVRIEPK